MMPVRRVMLRCVLVCLLAALMLNAVSGQDSGTLETGNIVPAAQTSLESIQARIVERLRVKEIGLVASRWDSDGRLLYRLSFNQDSPYAIASTFKGFVAFYYFMNVPQAEWDAAPGSDVYQMVVFSDNNAAGDVLAMTAAAIDNPRNPVEKFNDFMRAFFGFSDASGIYGWDSGALTGTDNVDARYAPDLSQPGRYVSAYGERYTIRNRYTTRDAATAIEMLANIPFNLAVTDIVRDAYVQTRTLMSVSDPRYPTYFDRSGFDTGAWRKYGYLSKEEAGVTSQSEVVVIPAPDGGHMTIAMLSGGEQGGSFRLEMANVFSELVRFDHRWLLNLPAPAYDDIPAANPVGGQFNYGYVLPIELSLYRQPDGTAEHIVNELRDDMLFPTAPIYQEALIRFTAVNDTWGHIEWNDERAPYRGEDAYFRLKDVYTVDNALFEPLPDAESAPRKYVIVDKRAGAMYLLEGETVIFATPIIANRFDTDDGEHGIGSRRISDSRAGFPFVAFIARYGDSGQAIYSAPWEWWSQTYTQHDNRYSNGDILIPDWPVDIPGYGQMRADTFVFKWLGGFEHPADELSQPQQHQMLLYVVRSNLDELLLMTYPGTQRNRETGWNTIIDHIKAASLTAPASYFSEPR